MKSLIAIAMSACALVSCASPGKRTAIGAGGGAAVGAGAGALAGGWKGAAIGAGAGALVGGAAVPAADNKSAAGRAKHRRVELHIDIPGEHASNG